jgi:triphosphoribosyl-dephospho-CoA synthase
MYNDVVFKLGEFALEAMLYEVSCFPSFGLVSPISNGSHKDMNYYTFVDSSTTLYRYFLDMAHAGYSSLSPQEIFSKGREIGKKAEEEMFEKTNGVNTHKGMLFVLGIGVLGTSKAIYENSSFLSIQDIIMEMTQDIVEKELTYLEKKSKLSHGENIFLKYGISGVRGEAEKGFPTVFNYALNLYENSNLLDENKRLSHTLLGIMGYCEDSTILHRHDLSTLKKLQEKSKTLINSGGFLNPKLESQINKLDQENIKCNISPGGCADLLALTIFMSKVKNYFFT